MASNLDIFTPIWETVKPQFEGLVSDDAATAFTEIGMNISSENYAPVVNEIYNNLINMIVKQKVWDFSISNKLASFKSGEERFGDTFQEIAADIIAGEDFDIAEDDQFQKWPSTVDACYHRINRKRFFPITVEETHIQRAFTTSGGLQALLNQIYKQMTNGNNLEEYVYAKRMIGEFYNQTEVPLLATQKLVVPNPLINTLDPSVSTAFYQAIKGVLKNMTYPQRNYNAFGFMRETAAGDVKMLLHKDISLVLDTQKFTKPFLGENLDITVGVTELDDFGDAPNMQNCLGVIYEPGTFSILDSIRTVRHADNARNLYKNSYYHVHQWYAASPFKQCVYLMADGAVTAKTVLDDIPVDIATPQPISANITNTVPVTIPGTVTVNNINPAQAIINAVD